MVTNILGGLSDLKYSENSSIFSSFSNSSSDSNTKLSSISLLSSKKQKYFLIKFQYK